MVRIRHLVGVLLTTLLCAGAGLAELVSFGSRRVDIEYWAGTGSQRAVCVVDFAPGETFAFGYRWDGEKTSFDMLQAISAAGTMSFAYNTDFGSPFVDSITYAGRTMGAYWGWPDNWLGYFISVDGLNWADSWEGVSTRVLADGDWDGWSQQTTDAWPPAYVPDAPPQCLSLLSGRESILFGLERTGRNWSRIPPSSRSAQLTVYHNEAAANGSMKVCGMDMASSLPVSLLMSSGLTLQLSGGTLTAAIRDTIGTDVVDGRLNGEGSTTAIQSLSGTITLLERGSYGGIQSLFLYQWSFEAPSDN